MILKGKLLAAIGLVTLSTIVNQTVSIDIGNTRDTDYTYNGEEDPDFSKIDSNDWDEWCDVNSEYTRTDGKGYKNKYFSNRGNYNFGICAFPIDEAVASFSSSNSGTYFIVTNKGEVYSWGRNTNGQLGTGDKTALNLPTKIDGLTNIITVSSGGSTTLALDKLGRVWSWGNKDGNGHGSEELTPKLLLDNIISIETNQGSSYALSSDGEVFSWGSNSGLDSNIVNNPINLSKVAGSILNNKIIKSISSYNSGAIVMDDKGDLYGWGKNENGELGLGNSSSQPTPVKLTIDNVAELSTTINNSRASIIKLTDGTVHGTGSSYFLGIGGAASTSWQEMEWANNAKLITLGQDITFIIDSSERLISAGPNWFGEAGTGSTTANSAPKETILQNIIFVQNSGVRTFALNDKGEIYGFGRGLATAGGNFEGSSTDSYLTPIKMIQSKPAYMVTSPGKVGANSNDDYKYVYTENHPTIEDIRVASPLQMTSQNNSSPRYDSNSTISNDAYTTSNDYFTNSIGGEMCDETGDICIEIPDIREPLVGGPNFDSTHPDYIKELAELGDLYEVTRVRPVTFSAIDSTDSNINVPILDGARINSKNIKIGKSGQVSDNLVVLMEVYATNNTGNEVLIATERFDNKGANKADFVIEAANYYKDYKEATFKFRTYLDIDANKENGEIKYYSSIRTFTHAPLPSTGKIKTSTLILILTIVIVAGGALTFGYFYIKPRRHAKRY